MTEKNAKPQLRFAGFDDTWEQRKLDTITDVRDGTHDSPQYVETGHPFITSKNVKDGFINYEDIQYVSDKDYEEINKRSKVDKNDILMGMIGTIGNIALVRETPDFAIKNVALIKDIGDVHYRYLYHCLQSNSVAHQLDENLDGGTQKFIALNKIRELVIPVPSEHEQHKIGDYMESLDNLITLHQRKYDKLTNVKKSMLEKMFPKNGSNVPEIRFKGFSDAWEQRKLLEFGQATGGTSIESEFSEDGIYKVISIGSYSEDNVYRDQGIRAVRSDKTVNKILNKGDITMILNDKTASGNIIGRVLLIEESGVYVYNQRTERIEVDSSNYDSQFIYTMLNAPEIRDKIIKQSQGNTQIYVNWTTVSQTDYLVPQLSEQRKIGKYFLNLDNLITLHQRELEKLKNLKKACLEKMFV